MGGILTYLRELLFGVKKLDLIIIGLDNAGKTTLLNVLAHGHPIETLPTVCFIHFYLVCGKYQQISFR